MEGFKFWKERSKKDKANDIVSVTLGATVAAGSMIGQSPEQYEEPQVTPNNISEQVLNQSEIKEAYKTEFQEYLDSHKQWILVPEGAITLEHIGDTGPDSTVLLTFKINNEIVPVVFNGADGFTEQMDDFLSNRELLESA